jgi:hypothetical protein
VIQLHADPADLKPLVEVGLEPAEDAEHKGMTARASIATVRNKDNRIQLGVADPIPLLDNWPADEKLEAEIEAQLDRFDFSCVRLSLSFVPDRGCRFVWGRLHAELASGSDQGDPPVAFDLFPRDVNEKRTFKRSYTLTPKLSFAFGEVGAGATTESEMIRYEPRLSVAGLLTDTVTWTFDALDRSGLVGSSELFLVLKRSRDVPVDCRFVVAADVATYLGRVRLRRYSNPEVVERQHRLV